MEKGQRKKSKPANELSVLRERIKLLEAAENKRKRAAEEASRMATVVRDSNDAITIQDFEGRITAWNRGAELMFGYSEEEALRMTIWQLAPPNKAAEQKDLVVLDDCRFGATTFGRDP